ncbi:MAG: hypothetical protein A2622_04605 [Bdellovibrionales bacterium RIFCSPHIGHO2_01_FULL_40_29]|nr:MAG: hypothetical protein A2622_04605 [Bdellovibrionales bacterium RIFCSPHIGHO2_01_FULL_40_29]OFZ34785.1 MAG: hypothetical protein A3D17_10770 [Bdellovibrionales bacterium RIFCSPHIGHO2_02_FULL_40_15]
MKLFSIFTATALLATIAFAQTKINSSVEKINSIVTKSKGFTVGLAYSNLSDLDQVTSSYVKGTGIELSDEQLYKGGTQLGLMGIHLGYKDNFVQETFGFSSAFTIFKGINSSEISLSQIIYKIQGDLVVPFSNNYGLNFGANFAYITGSEERNIKYTPGLGGQIGLYADLGFMNFMLGYQSLSFRSEINIEAVGHTAIYKSEALVSGVITEVGFTF